MKILQGMNRINKALFVPVLTMLGMSDALASNQTFGGFKQNVQNLSFDVLQLIIVVMVVVGIIFVVMGALKLKQNHDQPNQGHAAKGFITLIVGILLLMPVTLTKILRNSLNKDLIVASDTNATAFEVGTEGVIFQRDSRTSN